MIEETVQQYEKNFTLNVLVNLQNDRVYGKGKNFDVSDENFFASTTKMSRKLWFPLQYLGTATRNRSL